MTGETESFWLQTPRTFNLVLRGMVRREERAHHTRAWQAWTTAALMRLKKMPTLDKVVGRGAKARQKVGRRSPEEQLARMAQWESVFDRLEGKR